MKQLKALVPTRLAAPLASLMSEAGASAVDTATEADAHGRLLVTAYCEAARARGIAKRCQNELSELARRAKLGDTPKVEISDVSADWETSWTQVLPPARLAPALVLVPEGVAYQAAPGERVIRLEPGLYFGFGEHPTTQLISEWIGRSCLGASVLDVGCGTGVLSFVAAFAGAASVFGIDIDGPSVASAQRNASNNGWAEVCTFASDPLQDVERRFGVVLANIDARTLTSLAEHLCRVLAPGGRLALTGVLEEQVEGVCSALSAAGVPVEVSAVDSGWALLTNTPRLR